MELFFYVVSLSIVLSIIALFVLSFVRLASLGSRDLRSLLKSLASKRSEMQARVSEEDAARPVEDVITSSDFDSLSADDVTDKVSEPTLGQDAKPSNPDNDWSRYDAPAYLRKGIAIV